MSRDICKQGRGRLSFILRLLPFAFFGGGIPLIAGLMFLWGAGQVNALSCTRLEPGHIDCQLQHRVLGIIPSNGRTLTKVRGVEVESQFGHKNKYWVQLLTDEEVVRGYSFAAYEKARAERQQIYDFLDNTGIKSFESSSGPEWLFLCPSIPLIGLGVWFLQIILSAVIKQSPPCL